MRIIFDEIRKEISNLLKRNAWVKWVCSGVGILVLFLIIKIAFFPSIEKGHIGGNESDKWAQMEKLVEGESGEIDFDLTTLDSVLSMFFMSANRMDVDMMLSVMTIEQSNEDFAGRTNDLEELFGLYNESMKKLTRNGAIDSIEIVGGNKMIGGNVRVRVNVTYRDLAKPVELVIILKAEEDTLSVGDFTEEVTEEQFEVKQYFVNTSIWEIIKKVESEVD
ncbi:MAG: hypothetical protein ABS939_02915 [Psychrobacillus sp.]